MNNKHDWILPTSRSKQMLCAKCHRWKTVTTGCQECSPFQKTQTTEIPEGAIYNGRVYIERLERDSQSEGRPLSEMVSWQELKNCFEHLVEYIREANS